MLDSSPTLGNLTVVSRIHAAPRPSLVGRQWSYKIPPVRHCVYGMAPGCLSVLCRAVSALEWRCLFLHLFPFLVSRPPQSALLHRQAPTLLLNRWLVCLTGSTILVLKLTFSQILSPVTFLSLSNGLISRFLSRTYTEVSGVENIGQCGRLSQLRWLLGAL